MPCYFFVGKEYIRVVRQETGPGVVDLGYPADISVWGWGEFGKNGIDAALSSGPKDYFFSGNQYIRVTRGTTGAGIIDADYPQPISNWGWGEFGKKGVDATLSSGTKCYFFSGKEYIRVTRGDTGAGTVDADYPMPISEWDWGAFGANGIDGALNSGTKDYFFSGREYIRVTRGDAGEGTIDAGYPAPLSNWGWGTFAPKGISAALFSGFDEVAGENVPPPVRLGNNSNFFLSDNGNLLTDVTVKINVTQDLVCQSVTRGSDKGFSFQLNCFSPTGHLDTFQQYVMTFAGSDVSAGIDDLPLTGTASDILLTSTKFASLKKGILPAGYQAQIALQNDQANNISGVTYSLIDENAKLVGSHTLTLATLTNGQKALAPIVAITLNIVGPFEGEDTLFSSGGGSITYQASNFLSVTNTPPSFVAETQFTTELSNSVYGELPSGPNRVNSQTFTIGAPA